MHMTPQLLTIEGLNVSYSTREGAIPAVADISLSLQQGECVGLVGESGCGKTTVALAIMRYRSSENKLEIQNWLLYAHGCISQRTRAKQSKRRIPPWASGYS